MRTLKLSPDALRVESFTVTAGETTGGAWPRSYSPPSCMPMCTDVSCTGDFPDCQTVDPAVCPAIEGEGVKTV
jgi:hypothetical protein